MTDLLSFKKIHIIGIAGAGLNGIANIFLDQGKQVSGSERLRNAATEYLESRGVIITADDDLSAVRHADVVVISSAVKEGHPLVDYAREHNTPVITRHAIWEEWSKQRDIIAVSESHGKTTTTAMIAHIFRTVGYDCGFLVGIHGKGAGSWGAGPLILEADEYKRTFLSLRPKLSVITSVDRDHVDVYNTDQEYEDAFRQFAHVTLQRGTVVACQDDAGVRRALAELDYLGYSAKDTSLPWAVQNLVVDGSGLRYQLLYKGEKITDGILPLPGEHNVLNALAAILVASQYGIEPRLATEALSMMPAISRRMQ